VARNQKANSPNRVRRLQPKPMTLTGCSCIAPVEANKASAFVGCLPRRRSYLADTKRRTVLRSGVSSSSCFTYFFQKRMQWYPPQFPLTAPAQTAQMLLGVGTCNSGCQSLCAIKENVQVHERGPSPPASWLPIFASISRKLAIA